MRRRLLVGLVLVVTVITAAVYLWAQAMLGSDPVREAVARQVSRALGQPVRIGSIRVGLLPRVTIALGDVGIGRPERITMRRLDLGTSLGALLSRRVEHATVEVVDGRIDLPLPAFNLQADERAGAEPALTIVSVDRIAASGLAMTSAGRTLEADVELVPSGTAVEIRRATLTAEGTSLNVTGRLDDASGPTGALKVEAESVDGLALLAFVGDFAGGTALPSQQASASAAPTRTAVIPMDLRVALTAARATFGALVLDGLQGSAAISNTTARVDPLSFQVFGGHYRGSLTSSLSATPEVRIVADVSDLDMAAVMRFAGEDERTFTGRLTGRLDITTRGATATDVLSHASGTGRVEVSDGTLKGLELVRAVVVATSMRTGSSPVQVEAGEGTFTRLGATLAIDKGVARTNDLRFESPDVLMSGTGHFVLDGSTVALEARLQLSDALSKQAGRDLLRYTAQDGRVTLPATISGRIGNLQVQMDALDVARRAITNRAVEEAGKAIRRGLGGLLRP